jgi:hypothetical protein
MRFAQRILLRLAQYSTGHAFWLWYSRPAIADSESPGRTVYEDGWPDPDAACVALSIAAKACADDGPSRVTAAAVTAWATAGWDGEGLASACGDKHNVAPTPASAGAAAIASRRGIQMRDVLLWRPKGLLSVQGALTGKAAQGASGLRSA